MKEFLASLALAALLVATPAIAQQNSSPPPALGTVQAIGQSHIPFVLPSSGTVGNNGALTVTTALPTIYANAYVYMPVGAIASGSLAGWYYAVFSSTTAATLYNNTYSAGTPTIPVSPTAFATTGPGAYTQSTGSPIISYSLTIKGGTVGPNGSVRITQALVCNNSAGVKSTQDKLNGTTFSNPAPATATSFGVVTGFTNLGATNIQAEMTNGSGTTAGSTTGPFFLAIDTTADVTYTKTLQLAAATDTVTMVSAEVTLIPGVP